MYDILSLFSVLYPHLSRTTVRQFSQVVIGLLAMTGQVSMLNISRWTSEGGSYRDGPTLFSTPLFLGGLSAGYFSARIYWIVKVPISSRETQQRCRNRGNPLMVYRVFSRLGMVKRSRV